jgi:hypothetical protein
MADTIEISVADLLFDVQNPRLASPNQGQRETLRALATSQGPKLRALAEDIVTYGLDPSELTIVMASIGDAENRFVVLDGNRRLAALRALENPDVVAGAITANVLSALRRLSQEYQTAPIDSIPCVVVKDRDEARHWLELRHMGERGGAGPVFWGADESARFRVRSGRPPEIQTQALNFLERHGDFAQDVRSKVRTTTLQRLLTSPQVRSKLGLEWSDQQLKAVGDEDAVAKALMHVVNDIANGTLKVGHVYTADQRNAYADRLPSDIVVAPARTPDTAVPLGDAAAQQAAKKGPAAPRLAKPREHLIPRDCVLQIHDARIHQIETELRRLKLEDYPNAVSVLFRVFLELSVDAYIGRVPLATPDKAALGTKLEAVTSDLVTHKKLTGQQAKPVRAAAQKNRFLAPSVTTMHQWVHNQYMFPGPSDLRADWDNLQPWFVAVWSP